MSTDLIRHCQDRLLELEQASLRRQPHVLQSGQDTLVTIDGRQFLSLASNNYLDLAQHPRVLQATIEAITRWGAGSGAARLVVGTFEIHRQLEQRLAAFKGQEDAVLYSSGYMANLAVASLLQPGDAVFSDRLNHASIIDACRLSRTDVHIYDHASADDATRLMRSWRQGHTKARALLITDSIFSMDGDLAPLPALAAACEQFGVALVVDEAHATGVVGRGGCGAVAAANLGERVDVLVGTLSKALGSAGGFIAGQRDLCELLRNQSRTFVFDTAPAPATVAAALAALQAIDDEPERVTAVQRNMAELATLLGERPPPAAILPIMIGDPRDATALARRAFDEGLLLPVIRPPTVPDGTSRLRVAVTAGHTPEQLRHAATFLRQHR